MKSKKRFCALFVALSMAASVIPCFAEGTDVTEELTEEEVNQIIEELTEIKLDEEPVPEQLPFDELTESEEDNKFIPESLEISENNVPENEEINKQVELFATTGTKFPAWKEVYHPDYSDGVLDCHTDCINGYTGSDIYEEDNKLNVKMYNFIGSGVKLSPVAPGVSITQDCVIEYTIERTLFEGQILDRIGCPGYDVGLSDIQVHAAGGALVAYRDSTDPGANQARKSVGAVGDNKNIRFVIYARFSTGKMDVYINDRLVVNDKYMRDSIPGFSFMNMYYDCDHQLTKCAIKDVNIYIVNDGGLSDEERVQKDADALNFKGIWREGGAEISGMYSGNLCLYDVAGNGSDVTWSCSDPSVVSKDGIVTSSRPVPVTLTATFTSGSAVATKDITFTPMPTSIDINETPNPEEIIYENDFESGSELPYEIDKNEYATGDIRIDGGSLVLERGDLAMSGPTVYLYSKERKPVSGLVGVEFDWRKDDGIGAWIRCGQIFFYWRSDGYLQTQTCSDEGSVNVYTYNTGNFKNKNLHIQFVYDTTTHQVSLWIDGVNKLTKSYARTPAQETFSSIYGWISENQGGFKVDNFKVYKAIPTALERLDYETNALNAENLITAPFVSGNIIDCDKLNLPEIARYGSSITWTSDNPDAIDEFGNVQRTGWSENPVVTLTATFDCQGLTREKKFTFTVMRDIGSGDAVKADMEDLNYSMLLDSHDADKDNVTLALKLMPRGLRGSKIMWYTDNSQYITTAGRVIRPKMGDGDAEVTLTADFGGGYKKNFTFTVKEDYLSDKQWHKDEDFFGLWGDGEWIKAPKINYGFNNDKNLALAEESAKAGDYYECKVHILDYWKKRKKTSSATDRFPLAAKIVSGHIYHENEENAIDVGVGTIKSHDYERVEIELSNKNLFKDAATLGISLMSLYSDNATISIRSREFEDGKYAPKLQLVVNGVTKTYDVSEDLTIRAGKYFSEKYGHDDALNIRLFGDFMGDESQRTLMRFNYDYISSDTDTIDSARLILTAKVEEPYVDAKEIAIMVDKASFNEDSSWDSITGFLYQWDGSPGKNTWATPRFASSEYLSQMCRFNFRGALMAEYSYTKNEDYAYLLISEAMDHLYDQGEERTYSVNTGAGTSRSLYGNYLACAGRAGFYNIITSDMIDSRYMTPEIFGTLLKSSWDYEDVIYRTNLGTDMVNWGVIYYKNLMSAAAAMPEFYISDDVFDKAREKLESFMLETTFEDGSYKEAATMYSVSTLGTYRLIKQTLREFGFDTSEEYDERLKLAGLYCLLLNGTRYTRWGDSGMKDTGGYASNLYEPYVQFFNDYEMQYIGTYGSKGIEPKWTSKLFKNNMTCFMHSDWGKNETFLFTNARGGGNHMHRDDNHIFLSSKDRTLLTDQGIGTYDAGNEQREWLTGTIAHNTVEINNANQQGSGSIDIEGQLGKLYGWSTSSAFDFLSQNTVAYREHEHRRTITFVKPDFIIVSDRMEPKNPASENVYKQIWHTPIDGKVSVDFKTGEAETNYSSGANLYISSVKDETTPVIEDGWFDYGTGAVGVVPFLYYKLENVKGPQVIDTVLLPYEGNASVSTERLDKSLDKAKSTSLKINVDRDGDKETSYYVMNYDNDAHNEVKFGDFSTDATMALVTFDKSGNLTNAEMHDGSYIKNADGQYIINYPTNIENVSYSTVGAETAVVIGNDVECDVNNLTLYAKEALKTIKVDGINHNFSQSGNTIKLSSGTYEEEFKSDPSSGKGGIADVSGGGSSGGGGGSSSGGGGISGGNTPVVDTDEKIPGDIENHWAKTYIMNMLKRKVVNGYTDGSFKPDNMITRAEFIKMAVCTMGSPEAEYSGDFKDVNANDWFAYYVAAALDLNLISEDDLFRPNDNITREEICKIAAGMLGIENAGHEATFDDMDSVSPWAVPYVSIAAENNIVTGYEDNTFRPKNNATRAEATVILDRILTNFN